MLLFQFLDEVIVEKVYEKPVVVSHQEKAAFKETYEGKRIEKDEVAAKLETHVAKPIVKEIHQDVIHEHHKDVNIEHKKDVVREHHQNVLHEHHQPVVYEKHIHEHHQPIIHEKHQTLITEKNVPIVHEHHTAVTDKQTKSAIVDEFVEKAVIDKVVEKPVVTETFAKTELRKEGNLDATLLKEDATLKSTGGKTIVHETLEKDGKLLEDEEWVVDEKGQKRKQKKGFFGHLKDKITGHN